MFGTGKKKNKRGTSLVETLVAMIILALGITGAVKLVLTSQKLSDISSEKYDSVNLAKSRFEQMGMADVSDLSSWETSNMVCNVQGRPDPNGNYRINTMVTYINTNLAKVVIQVYIRNHVTREFDHSPEQITTYMSDI